MYEDAEKTKAAESTDNVTKTCVKDNYGPTKMLAGNRLDVDANITCYKCGIRG